MKGLIPFDAAAKLRPRRQAAAVFSQHTAGGVARGVSGDGYVNAGGTQKNGGVTSASWPERAAALAAVGLLYGLLLTGVGLGIANGGDGPMIPLYVFSSPFFFPLVIFAPITFWLFIGLLLASADERGYRAVFLVLMAMHYLGTAPYLLPFSATGSALTNS